MMKDRFYSDSTFDTSCFIEGSEFHHLIHVMRNQEGDEVELVNGRGQLCEAKIEKIQKKTALLSIQKIDTFPRLVPEIFIALPLLRMEKLEWAVEKCTELGAASFRLFHADLSEKKALSNNQLDHLHQMAIASMKQCKRLYLPKIELFESLSDAWMRESITLFGDTNPKAVKLSSIPDQSPIVFFSGPEKGFSKNEIEFLQSRAQGIKLHPNILRAETAPLAALSLLSQKWL